MKKVNVAKLTAVSTVANRAALDTLADGALAVFDAVGTKLNFSSISTDRIGVFVGGQVGIPDIKLANLNMVKEAYIAPVNKVMTVGHTGSGTGDVAWTTPFTSGSYAGVSIHTPGYTDDERPYRNYDIELTPTTTEAVALAALVAKINADPFNTMVTAAVTNSTSYYGLSLTGKSNRLFSVVARGELSTSAVAVGTNWTLGFGTKTLVEKELFDAKAELGGRDEKYEYDLYTGVAVTDIHHICYTFLYTHDRVDGLQSFSPAALQTYRLYVLHGSAVATALDLLLAEVN